MHIVRLASRPHPRGFRRVTRLVRAFRSRPLRKAESQRRWPCASSSAATSSGGQDSRAVRLRTDLAVHRPPRGAAGHTPSGASRHLPQQSWRRVRAATSEGFTGHVSGASAGGSSISLHVEFHSGDRCGEGHVGGADSVGGDEKHRPRHRVWGIGDEHRDEANVLCLHPDPPGAAEIGEHHRDAPRPATSNRVFPASAGRTENRFHPTWSLRRWDRRQPRDGCIPKSENARRCERAYKSAGWPAPGRPIGGRARPFSKSGSNTMCEP